MFTQKAISTLTLVLTAALLFSSCGAKKISNMGGSTTQSSRTPIQTTEDPTSPAAACNDITQSFFTAGTMVYIDTVGNARNEALRLKLESVASEFQTNSKYFIQFFRWKMSGGTPVLDNQPLEFAFELTSNRARINGTATVLNNKLLTDLANGIGLSDKSLSNTLNTVNMILNLNDPKAEWDAIKIVAYRQTDTSGSSTVVTETDSLIPAFYADPRQYAIDNGEQRAGALISLHPFYSTINNTSMTTAQYGTQSKIFVGNQYFSRRLMP